MEFGSGIWGRGGGRDWGDGKWKAAFLFSLRIFFSRLFRGFFFFFWSSSGLEAMVAGKGGECMYPQTLTMAIGFKIDIY